MANEKSITYCSRPGCDREVNARGLCLKHYKQAIRSGEIEVAAKPVYAPVCAAEGCGRDRAKREYCDMHYRRLQRFGRLENVRQPPGSLVAISGGYLTQRVNGVKKLQHVMVAEAALGKPLPRGAEVHHVNENPGDNRPENLVICPDRAYHMLLHVRQDAMNACGNPDWRKCIYCKTYDAQENMTGRALRTDYPNTFYHKKCAADYVRSRKAARRTE